MAATNLLALLDDITTVLDDVATLTKIATKKTAGVLGDDLALNAQQVAGVRANREIPVVMAVAKGSAINKLILVPAALLISVIAPWLITPLLMIGGLFLCYEGFEKVAHSFLHSKDDDQKKHEELVAALDNPGIDMVDFEQKKIKGAIRTDFILSAEIIVITLGAVAGAAFTTQVAVLVLIAVLMTIGVYGLVAGIVKLDDLGLYLSEVPGQSSWRSFQRQLGQWILFIAPYFMKTLSIVGTAAMFLVGGGILAHGIPGVEHWIHEFATAIGATAPLASGLVNTLANGLLGIVAGAIVVGIVSLFEQMRGTSDEAH